MLGFRMNRRGSIPVTIFVIVVLVLIITVLASFSIKLIFDKGNISEGFEKVQEFNSNIKSAEFLGIPAKEEVRKYEKDYFVLGKESLKLSVTRIP